MQAAQAARIAAPPGQRRQVSDLRLIPQLRAANEHLVIATFEARDSLQAAEAQYRRQAEFLSMVSHELRGPLYPIVVANQLIGEISGSHPDLPMLHALIKRQAEQLTRLVDDLTDAARASNGKILVQRHRMVLQEAITNAVESSQYVMAGRHQQLHLDLPAAPVQVDGDLVRLTQVFSNLLLNASKYSPEHGQITLRMQPGPDTVQVQVSDNGCGIPTELQPLIFDLFARGPRAERRAPGGLGIGLTLVRAIAELHGGTVRVDSAGQGLGSQFSVVLPLAARRARRRVRGQAPGAGAHAPPRNILYIEDHPDTSEVIARLLLQEGHAVTCRYDGPSGLAAAQSTAYDAIICDVDLPGLTGFDIARTLRQQAGVPRPHLIALSGFAADDMPAAATQDFDHYLVKPVSLQTLSAILQPDESHERPPGGGH